MGPDFSERQYEFAVNFELTSALSAYLIGGLPRIPTTNEEARKGFDALFDLGTGYVYHLQYKVGTYASRLTPKNPSQWAYHSGHYYRFQLHGDSHGVCSQHTKLEKLRAVEPGVYYVAPSFYRERDFWSYAAASTVFDNSALIDVADVPLPSPTGPHAITYDDSGGVAVWSEEGRRTRGSRNPDIRRREPPRELSPALFRDLLLHLVDALASEASIAPRVPRAEAESGLRESIIAARATDAAGGERRMATWPSAGEARAAYHAVPDDRDRARAAEQVKGLDDLAVLRTASRIAALDFDLTTVVEPARGPR